MTSRWTVVPADWRNDADARPVQASAQCERYPGPDGRDSGTRPSRSFGRFRGRMSARRGGPWESLWLGSPFDVRSGAVAFLELAGGVLGKLDEQPDQAWILVGGLPCLVV